MWAEKWKKEDQEEKCNEVKFIWEEIIAAGKKNDWKLKSKEMYIKKVNLLKYFL